MEYADEVKAFIVERFLFGDDSQFDDDASFLDTGIIDSTGVLELVAFIESKFSIKVDDDELLPENLDGLANISGYLKRKLEKR